MADSGERRPDERGLSARYLILVFLMGVAACAVFFSLGFLVGYSERSSKAVSSTEQVTPVGAIPATINPPLEASQSATKETPPLSGGALPTERISAPEPVSTPPKEQAAVTKPAAPPAKPAARSAPSGGANRTPRPVEAGFTVQVAASREKQDAEKLVRELRSRGFDVFVVTPRFSDAKDNLYRVQVGPFATREEAARVRDRVAKEGFKPFIRQ